MHGTSDSKGGGTGGTGGSEDMGDMDMHGGDH
jgi:hypothetical protein